MGWAKERDVPHSGKGVNPHHRILEQTLPDGRKIYGYSVAHDYDNIIYFLARGTLMVAPIRDMYRLNKEAIWITSIE